MVERSRHNLARGQSRLPCGIVVLIVSGICGFSLAGAAAQEAKGELGQKYERDFKGLTEKSPEWGFAGPDAEKFVKFEPEGVHITLPTGYEGARPEVGVATRLLLNGDFEVTMRYEILSEPAPAEAEIDHTRITLGVFLAQPRANVASLSRRVLQLKGTQFFSWMNAWDEKKGAKAQRAFGSIPSQAKTGRLRMSRAGDTLSYHGADGDAEDFRLVSKAAFSSDDVTEVRFGASTGGAKAAFDVRVTELQIRAETIAKPPTAPPPAVKLAPPLKAYAQQFFQSFKEKIENRPGWEVENPGGEQNVRFESAGLRITLPPGREGGHRATGVMTDFGVQGDFEITLSFEILKEADPGTDRSVLDLVITKDVPKADVATVGRPMSPKDGRRFIGWSSMWNSVREKKVPDSISVPTKVMMGRLRLVRSGADLYYGFSDGFAGDFRYFKKFLFGPEDVRRVRIVGSTDGDKATLEVRVIDFRIRADAIPNMPAGSPAPAEPAAAQPPPAPGKGGLALTLAAGIAIPLLAAVALGAVFYWRRRNAPTASAAPPTFLSLACPGCGKKLKVKAELAGKKVKCGQCGKAVLVEAGA
jgi:hypothetical protein